ncbi:bifunctional [glutamine synthetase] adenylyltransferase/[glutamine synthetase]-adenylyl-L-tyrosine phosphorylase, partial [Polymorphospora sp. 2-325]
MTRPTSAQARLARYGFGGAGGPATRPGTAAADLLGPDGLGLWNPATHEPTDGAAAELLAALSRAADPDLALRQLHRLVESERRTAPDGPGVVDALHADQGLRRRLIAVLGASSALGDHLVANPDQWRVLVTGADGAAPPADGRLEPEPPPAGDAPATGPAVGKAAVPGLRRAYRRALLRIAAADLTGGRG